MHDDEVLSSFETIVWVSVGQEPDIRELQSSIHLQLTEAHLPEEVTKSDEAILVIRKAAKKRKCLLVLDDVWHAAHTTPLNFVDGRGSGSAASPCSLTSTRSLEPHAATWPR